MKIKSTLLASIFAFFVCNSFAQTTAMNFSRNDCNGTNHDLFTELNAGNAVILEFFMLSCTSCVTAGQKLENMKAALSAQYPGKIKSYALGYSNSYTCTNIKNWVTTNAFTSTPMDSGAAQVAYYGGFGMPTIVILGGGTSHSVLGSPYISFSTSDTTTMATDIRNFLNSANTVKEISAITNISLFPNPSRGSLNVTMNIDQPSVISINIVDVLGNTVSRVIINEKVHAGSIHKKVDTDLLAEGLYFAQITCDGKVTSLKFNISR